MDLSVGDRVVCIDDLGVLSVKTGELGVILDFDRAHNFAYVRWDEYKFTRHDCSGRCEDGYGWNVTTDCLARVIEDLGELELEEGVSVLELLG